MIDGTLELEVLDAVQADPSRVVTGTVAACFAADVWTSRRIRLSWLERDAHGTVTPGGAWSTVERIGRAIDKAARRKGTR